MSLICITGTPGVGKTTISGLLRERGFSVVSVNEIAEREGLFLGRDPLRGYLEVDIEGLCRSVERYLTGKAVLEGHLSHFCRKCDAVIVLRLDPEVLRERLLMRGYPEDKVQENLEAEALDVCTVEAHEIHGERVREVDTTGKTPEEVADIIMDILDGDEGYAPGGVDFSDWLMG